MREENFRDQRRYQDIAIFDMRDGSEDTKTRKSNPFVVILVTVLVTVLLIAVGYFACLKTGLIAPPPDPCCFGVLELDFDFNALMRGA